MQSDAFDFKGFFRGLRLFRNEAHRDIEHREVVESNT